MGLVNDIFDEDTLDALKGHMAIGHVRYSTYGSTVIENAQPLVVNNHRGGLAVAHNGNLVNAGRIRHRLEESGSIFQSTSDTEVVIHLMAQSRRESLIDRLTDALTVLRGSYSLVMLTEGKLIAARDPRGFRPLVLGRLKDTYVVASETCALDLIEARYIRDVAPGEIIIFDEDGLQSYFPFPEGRSLVLRVSNISISPGPIRSSSARTSIRSGNRLARSWPARTISRRTS